jgi:hypothetical protein
LNRMAYYYQPVDGTVTSRIAVGPDGSTIFARPSLTAVPPPASHIGHSMGPSPVSQVVFPSCHQSMAQFYRQPMMAPMALAPYQFGMRPALMTPSNMAYQPMGVAPPSAPLTQLVPRPYVGGPIGATPQQGISFVMGGTPGSVASNGLYSVVPSYNFPATSMYQYPAISSPYCQNPPPVVASPYLPPPHPARIPVVPGPVVALGHRGTMAVNSHVPRGASYHRP